MKKKNSPTFDRPNKSGNPRPKAGSPTPRPSQFKHVASSNYFQVEESMFAKNFNPFISLLTVILHLFRKKQLPALWLSSVYSLSIDKRIRDPEYRTLLLLHLLAAQHNSNPLPPTSVQTLAGLRHVTPRSIYLHLNRLSKLHLIQFFTLPSHELVITVFSGKLFNSPEHVEHVVINKHDEPCISHESYNNNNTLKQQHEHVTETEVEDLQIQLAEVFIEDGQSRPTALLFAKKLINDHGYQSCFDQLYHLDRRCDHFREKEGLKNRSGVLIASIRNHWSPPPLIPKPQDKAWYTDDEFNQLIEH
jgi:hypothetical protein